MDPPNCGIFLGGSSNNSISGNSVTSRWCAILVSSSSNNYISDNYVANNTNGTVIVESSNNHISSNIITENFEGISLLRSSDSNVFFGNSVVNNSFGIRFILRPGDPLGSDNEFYHNSLANNTQQVELPTSSGSINSWDDGYPSGGNYWSDYETRYPDASKIDDSGIWDTPYVINVNNQDNYPLMHPWSSPTTYMLTITPSSGGSTDPSSGSYMYDAGNTATITAIADNGYELEHWELDSSNVGSDNPINVLMDANHTLEAFFTTLPSHDVEVINVDPIQVVSNAPALVTDKETAIRIDITSTSVQDLTIPYINVTYDFGKPYQEKGPNGNGITIKEGTNRIYVPGGPVYQKQGENWIARANAWVPPEGNDFFFKWTTTGTDNNIRAKIPLDDSDPNNNEKTATSKKVVNTKTLSIAWYKIVPTWFANYGAPTDAEYYETVFKNRDFVTAVYPVSQNKLSTNSYFTLAGNPIPILGMYLDLPRLWLFASLAGCNHGIGIVSDAFFQYHNPNPLDPERARLAAGFSVSTIDASFVREGYWTVASHEIAHTYLRYATFWAEEYVTDPSATTRCDGFWVKDRKQITNGVCMMNKNPEPGNSYDHDGFSPPGPIWVCEDCFDYLCNQFSMTPLWGMMAADVEKTLLIRGYVCQNGTVELEPLYVLQDVPESSPEPGNCSIRLVDNNGTILSETPFAISYELVIDPVGTFETDVAPFAFSLPWQENTSNIQILLNGSTAFERPVTSNIPSVQVTYPDGGENLIAGENCTISWNASDLDGDDLLYTVLYSADGGVNWNPLIIDLNETSYVWDTSHLQKGTNYLLRLIATDGVNTGEDVSNSTFTVKVHDIEATGNAPSKTVIGQGYALSVNATLTNEGDFTETFNATLCANTTAIASQALTLTSGNSTTITFTWNTTGFAKGNYIISAHVEPVEGETDIGDNNCTGGLVVVTWLGDLNGDFVVDEDDLWHFCGAFIDYYKIHVLDPNCDYNDDCHIDEDDLWCFCGAFIEYWKLH
jgi:parallel beta-helix repeat protein